MTKRICFNFIIFLSIFSKNIAQELPPIVKYPANIYGAGNQNWAISQDKNRYVYFANNEGLLEFNGSSWTLFKSPNETIIRSVKVIDNLIYTGCYMEFGYWKRANNGKLVYNSLSEYLKTKILDDEQFWNIYAFEQFMIFQSLNRIYLYDTKSKTFRIITSKNTILKAFKTENAIYYQVKNEGLFEIENGNSKLISNDNVFKSNKIISIFDKNDYLLIISQNNGIFKLYNNTLTKSTSEFDLISNHNIVYSSCELTNKNLAIGTVSNGIYVLNESGKIVYHINQNRGLINNTALSLYEDLDQNLWVGLDNGINCINMQSPIKSFTDDTGILGTVYATILFKNTLYIGTNQGLFAKNINENNEIKFIEGTKGQVWSLFVYDNELFCGHDSGTYIIRNYSATNIFSQSGTWKFESNPTNADQILQGNYFGISVLEKINNQWVYKNKIQGFDYSSKHFEFANDNEIYISHEYKGIFRITIDKNLDKIISKFDYTTPKKGKNACLEKFNNIIYYASKEGIFELDSQTKKFTRNNKLSLVFEKDEYTSGKMIYDSSNKIWFFSKNYIHYFTLSKLNSDLKQNIIPIPSSLTNSMLGYENVSQLMFNNYIIGTTDGYYTMNINDLSFKNYNVYLTNITINKLNEKNIDCSLKDNGSFDDDENNITFTYTVPEFNKYINADFQYLLEGFQNDWSEWSSKNSINFKNLPPGDYVFKVRSKIANSSTDKIVQYSFTIKKPWYGTNLALLIYAILILIVANFVHKTYKKYYQKQKEKLIEENNLLLEIKELENEQQLMKIRNEQLIQDVDTKNKELAVSTMTLINKNELLTVIKEDLKKKTVDGNDRNLKSLITTINKNISEEDSWNTFKEAFDVADKDFLKKVKALHPSLTPNDLRLCAYLRLNLSSKEIAPMLNISVRSVEIKRYRLRKKMELSHENGLVDYILSI